MNEIELSDIYETDDIEISNVSKNDVKMKKSGVLIEVEMNGKKFHTVDPAEFAKLENMVNELQRKLILNEQYIRQLQGQIRNRDIYLRTLKRELDTKVSHET